MWINIIKILFLFILIPIIIKYCHLDYLIIPYIISYYEYKYTLIKNKFKVIILENVLQEKNEKELYEDAETDVKYRSDVHLSTSIRYFKDSWQECEPLLKDLDDIGENTKLEEKDPAYIIMRFIMKGMFLNECVQHCSFTVVCGIFVLMFFNEIYETEEGKQYINQLKESIINYFMNKK